jgi:hypothetical protein
VLFATVEATYLLTVAVVRVSGQVARLAACTTEGQKRERKSGENLESHDEEPSE